MHKRRSTSRFFALVLGLSLALGPALPAEACAAQASIADCHDAAPPPDRPCDAPCCTLQAPAETAPALPLADRLLPQPDFASGGGAATVAVLPVLRQRRAHTAAGACASGASSISLHVLHAAFLN